MRSYNYEIWIIPALMAVASGIIVWLLLRKFRKQHPGRRFQIRITDIWALTLGLTPSFFWCSQAPKDLHLILTVMLGQIVGALWLHLHNESGSGSSKKNGFGAAVNVFVGAILGATLPLALIIGIGICMRFPWIAFRLFSADSSENAPRVFRRPDFSKIAFPKKKKRSAVEPTDAEA